MQSQFKAAGHSQFAMREGLQRHPAFFGDTAENPTLGARQNKSDALRDVDDGFDLRCKFLDRCLDTSLQCHLIDAA